MSCTLLAGGAGEYSIHGLIEDVAHHASGSDTADERLIEHAARSAFGVSASVRCVPARVLNKGNSDDRYEIQGNTYFLFPANGFALPVIELIDRACEEVRMFHDDPVYYDRWTAKYIEDAVHEISHLIGNGHDGGERREGVVECYAVQRMQQFVQGLGTTAQQAALAALTEANNYRAPTAEYTPPAGCHDGGPYDLDPAHPGNFPGHPYDAFLPPDSQKRLVCGPGVSAPGASAC